MQLAKMGDPMDTNQARSAAGSPDAPDASRTAPEEALPVPAPSTASQDPSSTGPLSLQAINDALALNQLYYEQSQAEEAVVRKRGRRLARMFGLAAAVAAIAVVGLLAYMQVLVNTVGQIEDERVIADIMADEAFAQGSASDAFVVPSQYRIDSVDVGDRQTDGSDIIVKADVQMSNEYFSESRKVTVRYSSEGDEWSGACTVDSHEVHPLRGIAGDDELGIFGDAIEYDAQTQTCVASRWVDGAPADTWFLTTQGTELVNYAFADDTWTRIGVDDSQLTASFQGIAGSYAPESGQSLVWTAATGSGQLQDFEITWVDDATGTFGGTFTWTSGTSRRFSSSQEVGEFSGWIDRDGNVGAQASGDAGTMAFTGHANESGGLNLDYTVYYHGFDRYFGSEEVSQAAGNVTLYRGGVASGSAAIGNPYTSSSQAENIML